MLVWSFYYARGHRAGYEFIQDILLKAAAQTEDGPCCVYFGPSGADIL